MNSLSHFHFLYPLWFLALIPALIAILYLKKRHHVKGAWAKVCDAHLLTHLIDQQVSKPSHWPIAWLAVIWLLMVTALAGPAWQKTPQPVFNNQQARVIVLDLSPSMFATDIKPSRLVRAKFKVRDLLQSIHEGRTAMVAFSGEAYTVSPLTTDSETIATMVPELSPNIMPVSGNDISAGLMKASQLLQQGDAKSGDILLITNSTPDEKAIHTAKQLAAEGYKTFVLPIGSQDGAPIPMANGGYMQTRDGNIMIAKLDTAKLNALAKAGDGKLVAFTNNNSDIQTLITDTRQSNRQWLAEQEKEKTNLWRNEGRWLLLPLILLLLLGFRRGWYEEVLR